MQLGIKNIIDVTMKIRIIRDTGNRYEATNCVRGMIVRAVIPDRSKSIARVFLDG
jgi:hypothetical protein